MTTTTARMQHDLLDFLLKETADRKLALRCAGDIHGPVCMFGYSQRGFPPSNVSTKKLSPGKAVRGLERLERTAKSGGVRWTNAWNALTRPARDCLVSGNPGKPVPMTPGVPNPADIAPLIPGALALARTRGKALTERKIAVVTILKAYRRVYNAEPTVKTVPSFIETIEKIYRNVLPASGFNVGSSSTLHSLIVESRR
jgi:hypothetical protein